MSKSTKSGEANWLTRRGERSLCPTTVAQHGFICSWSLGSSCSWRRNPAIETQIGTTNILPCCSISSSSTQTSTEEGLSRSGLAHSWFCQASAISCSSLAKICLKIFWCFPHMSHKLESEANECFPDYVLFIYRKTVKYKNTFPVQKGRRKSRHVMAVPQADLKSSVRRRFTGVIFHPLNCI